MHQEQNTVLTKQLESYKEKVWVLKITKGNNTTFFNEYVEADQKAKRFKQESQSQFIHDRDVIRDLEQQRDRLYLSVVEFKRQIMELQKSQSILKQKMSKNEDKYHDAIIDLEARAKKNEDVVLKIDNSMEDEIEKIQSDSIKIQEGMQKRINIPENDVQKCQIQSLEFELQLQHEKERRKCESSLKNICETFWISKMEKLESESMTRTQTQGEINELIENVNQKTYAYADVHAQNQDLLITISELKAKLKNAEKGLRAISRVRRPSHKDSLFKNSVLSNTKNSSEKVEVSVRTNKTLDVASKNYDSNKKIVTNDDIKNALIAKNVLCVSYAKNVLIPFHDNCLAKYKLNVHSKVRRALFTTSRTVKSKFEDPTPVVSKTRFSIKTVQSKSLDTTLVVSKTNIAIVTPLSAKHKVSSAFKLRDCSLSNYMKKKI
ncbi:hypothetical protein Tco_0365512 [Tanacetum coccineum]